jgi:hypothetical protein
MKHSKITSQSQANIRVHGQVVAFFNRFRIGTLLHLSNESRNLSKDSIMDKDVPL